MAGPMHVEFKDPPVTTKGVYKRKQIDPRRTAMAENPGQWIVWSRNKSSQGTYLKKQGYESVSRTEGSFIVTYSRLSPVEAVEVE